MRTCQFEIKRETSGEMKRRASSVSQGMFWLRHSSSSAAAQELCPSPVLQLKIKTFMKSSDPLLLFFLVASAPALLRGEKLLQPRPVVALNDEKRQIAE